MGGRYGTMGTGTGLLKREKSMSNKGKGRQHINVLVPSSPDMILLCDALDHRYRELCQLHGRVTGEPLIPPAELDRDLILWRQMFVRHRSRDNRHTADEKKSVERICQWTVDVKCRLTDQPRKIVEFAN